MLYVLSFCIKSELRDIIWFLTIHTYTYTIIKENILYAFLHQKFLQVWKYIIELL